jgi:hypothetical protein
VVEVDPTLKLPKVRTPSGAPKPATDEIWDVDVLGVDASALVGQPHFGGDLRREGVWCGDREAGAGGVAGLIPTGRQATDAAESSSSRHGVLLACQISCQMGCHELSRGYTK